MFQKAAADEQNSTENFRSPESTGQDLKSRPAPSYADVLRRGLPEPAMRKEELNFPLRSGQKKKIHPGSGVWIKLKDAPPRDRGRLTPAVAHGLAVKNLDCRQITFLLAAGAGDYPGEPAVLVQNNSNFIFQIQKGQRLGSALETREPAGAGRYCGRH